MAVLAILVGMNRYEVFKDIMATVPSEAQDRIGGTRFILEQHELGSMDDQQLGELMRTHLPGE